MVSGSLPQIGLSLTDLNNHVVEIVNAAGSTTSWTLSEFGFDVDLTHITQVSLVFYSTVANAGTFFANFTSAAPCLVKDTMILMADGHCKPIQAIQRGDWVATDPDCLRVVQVSRLNRLPISSYYQPHLVRFAVGSLGPNVPNRELLITHDHPLLYQEARRPAKCFKKLTGVRSYDTVCAYKLLAEEDPDNTDLALYDLQFDRDGSYVANGVTVQSRCPRSQLTPLPRELYFDPSLYREEVTWDSFDHTLPLDVSQVPGLSFQEKQLSSLQEKTQLRVPISV